MHTQNPANLQNTQNAQNISSSSLSSFRLIPLGIGDAFSAQHYSSCLALQAQGKWLLIDCPHPIRKMLREASEQSGIAIDVGDFEAIALTHLHADHASGLEGFAYFSFFVLRQKAKLIAHPEVTDDLWGHLRASMDKLVTHHDEHHMQLDSYFDITHIEPEKPVEIGPFRIECRKTFHHIPTTAFRITADGAVLGYSADTAFDPELIAWLNEADLIIHETNYGIHTPYEKLAALPAEIRQKMRLIHAPDGFDEDNSTIEMLKQGRVYNVKP